MSTSEISLSEDRVDPFILLELSISRSPKGIKILAKSAILEEFFKQSGLATDEFYNIPNSLSNGNHHDSFYYIDRDNYSLMIGTNRPNLGFLRRVGLSQGLEFYVHDILTDVKADTFLRLVNDIVTQIYNENIKPIEKRLTIKCLLS